MNDPSVNFNLYLLTHNPRGPVTAPVDYRLILSLQDHCVSDLQRAEDLHGDEQQVV